MQAVWLVDGPPTYQEAVTARLERQGTTVVLDEPPWPDRNTTVVLAYCSSPQAWDHLESCQGSLGRTAVIDQLDLDLYLRAVRSVIGVVHIDTSSETIVAVALASSRHETVLPAEVARQIATGTESPTPTASVDLEPLETDLIRSIARGETLASIAERYFYSERTLRRRLQSVYLKLDVQDRVSAVRAADRLGLLVTD